MKIGIPFQRIKEDFLTQMKVANYTYTSIRAYKYPLNRFLSFLSEQGVERIQDVSEDMIEQYRLQLVRDGLKTASLVLYLRTVRLLFRYLEETGEVFYNPAVEITVSRTTQGLQYIPTVEEMERFLDFDTPTPQWVRDKALFETAYSCGARLNELRMLDLKDVNLDKEELRLFGKGRKERIVPIGRHSVYWLEKYIREARPIQETDKNENALFLTKDGNRVTKIGIQKQIQVRQEKTGIPITMHAIRRACATHMLQGGAHPVEIQLLLGHADLSNLKQYLAVTITEIKETHNRILG